IGEASRLLDEGRILAVKGIGGVHIACGTTDDGPIARLRRTFNRPQQPFAVMSRDVETVRSFAEITPQEEKLLTSYRRPIVLLRKRDDFPLSELVSPGLDTVGVMLPYSGIHHLLLRRCGGPAYVMTSANISGLPMIIDNAQALSELRGKVDYLLLHNRRIANRCDDSVVKVVDGRTAFIRRSRGYVPEPVYLKFSSDKNILALGAEFNVTSSLLTGNRCFVSQHIGDAEKLETLEYLRSASNHLSSLLGIDRVGVIAHDLHPNYATTRLARRMGTELGVPTVPVQHHHAHLCALMAEHGLEEIVGVAADGVGYGEDGTAWGGEVMFADFTSYRRTGGLKKQRMPGGDLAAIYPARMVAGMLWDVMDENEIRRVLIERCGGWLRRGELEANAVLRQLETNLNVHWTTGCGRVLDAISCALGICGERTYEGEPAIKLEAVAASGDPELARIDPELTKEDGKTVLDTSKLLLDVIEHLEKKTPVKHIAAAAHIAIAGGLAEVAVEAAEQRGTKDVGASGGVFYNRIITRVLREDVERNGLRFLRHELLPCGDGCISVGQAISAAKRV
ncbi:MAG: carbamoyltransferase HypF, partial [Candidatus Hadarchaeales archaeon]